MKTLVLALCVACGSSAPAPQPPAAPAFTPTAFAVRVSGAGRPVLFIPGLGCAGDVWDGTVAHLGGTFQAHVLTLAGFGGQPAIAPPFLTTVHDQVIQYIKANKLTHPIIVGHSLGGVMALWLAETDPDISAAIDVDGFPFLAATADPKATAASSTDGAKQMRDQIASQAPDALFKMMRGFMAGMITKPADLDRVMLAVSKSDPATVGEAFYELFTTDLRPELTKITAPVLIVAAGDNGEHSDATAAAWHAQVDTIPHHDLQVVGGAKHFVMLDQPDAFYALVDGFLAHAP